MCPLDQPTSLLLLTPCLCFAGLLVASTLVLWVLCARHRKRQQQHHYEQHKDEQDPAFDGAGSSKQLGRGSASTNSRDRALLDSDDG